MNPGVLEVVRNAGLADRLGRERLLFNARPAIERYQALQATATGSQPRTEVGDDGKEGRSSEGAV